MKEKILACLERIAAIIRKELTITLMDKGSRAILIVPVIIQSVLFGYGATFNLDKVPWVLCDLSNSERSTQVERHLVGSRIFVPQHKTYNLADFKAAIDDGKALVGVYMADDFARTGEMYVVTDARNTTTASVALGYLSSTISAINEQNGFSGPVRIKERARFNENLLTRWLIMPGLILTLSMIQVSMLSGLTVSREREEGSFDMMLMTPAQSWEILIGKATVPFVVACIQACIVFCICLFWFGIPFSGSCLVLFAVIALFALSLVGVGLAISALAQTIQQSMVMVFLMLLPTVILAGFMTPILSLPEWLQSVSILNPLRSALDALRAVYFEGYGLRDVIGNLAPIASTAAATLTWATWLFRNKIA